MEAPCDRGLADQLAEQLEDNFIESSTDQDCPVWAPFPRFVAGSTVRDSPFRKVLKDLLPRKCPIRETGDPVDYLKTLRDQF